jgi:hypothetical protein
MEVSSPFFLEPLVSRVLRIPLRIAARLKLAIDPLYLVSGLELQVKGWSLRVERVHLGFLVAPDPALIVRLDHMYCLGFTVYDLGFK